MGRLMSGLSRGEDGLGQAGRVKDTVGLSDFVCQFRVFFAIRLSA